jgi:hypothetical protein
LKTGKIRFEMAKRKHRNEKAKEEKESDKTRSKPPPREQPNDFGGLPDIDFKKNLGCG